MKKFLALALALALGISLAATAFAEGLNLLGEAASLPEEAAAPAQARLEEAPAPETLPAADSFEEHKGAAGWIDVSSAQEWSAALDGIGTAGSTTCQIRLTDSFALPDTLTIAQGNTLELDLNGQTLTAAQGKRHLAVSGSLTLTDSGSGGALYGGDPAGNPGGGIEVWQDGMFTMKGGAITNCTAEYNLRRQRPFTHVPHEGRRHHRLHGAKQRRRGRQGHVCHEGRRGHHRLHGRDGRRCIYEYWRFQHGGQRGHHRLHGDGRGRRRVDKWRKKRQHNRQRRAADGRQQSGHEQGGLEPLPVQRGWSTGLKFG